MGTVFPFLDCTKRGFVCTVSGARWAFLAAGSKGYTEERILQEVRSRCSSKRSPYGQTCVLARRMRLGPCAGSGDSFGGPMEPSCSSFEGLCNGRLSKEEGLHCVCRISGCGLLFWVGSWQRGALKKLFVEPLTPSCSRIRELCKEDVSQAIGQHCSDKSSYQVQFLISGSHWKRKEEALCRGSGNCFKRQSLFRCQEYCTRGHQGQNRPPKLGCFFRQ
jgi:hypothetical protein